MYLDLVVLSLFFSYLCVSPLLSWGDCYVHFDSGLPKYDVLVPYCLFKKLLLSPYFIYIILLFAFVLGHGDLLGFSYLCVSYFSQLLLTLLSFL